jgi:hypothetical protein
MGSGADHCLCQRRYSTGWPVLIAVTAMSALRDTPSDVVTQPLSGGQMLVAQKTGYCGPTTRRACSKDFTLKHMKAFLK